MSLESSVKEFCAGLASVRVTERKKNAEALKDFLTRNAVPSLLSENTIKKKGYTWNDVFTDINEFVLKATEKFETSKTFDTVMAPLCANLLHLCVSSSNKGQAYIKCDKIMTACFDILKDKRLTRAIGDAYLNLLYKHILSCDHYLSYISPNTWKDLLDVCLTVCSSKYCTLDDFTKMRLLWLVMKNGKSSIQFVIPLRDSISRLKLLFIGVAGDKKVQEVVIDIMILLLETLSSECRLTMCEFTESLLTTTLKCYDQNLDQKKKSSFFQLLHMTVVIHHPQGRLQVEEGSLACDWSVWKKHLLSFVEIICLEANYMQKLRKQNDCPMKHCTNYFVLAASVYFQVFNLVEDGDESGNVSKRQRVSFNKNKSFNDLIEELRHNHVPWLAIINMYIKNHGDSIPTHEYLSLISIIEPLISSNNNLNWDIFEEIVCLIVKKLTSRSGPTKDEIGVVLLTFWNSCVRTSTLVNSAHKALHTIMQYLLTLDYLKYQNIQPLLKLYFDKGMPVTNHSVNTLNVIFHTYFSKCSYFDQRIKCFTWLIQGESTSVDVESVQELLMRLLANENINPTRITDETSEFVNLHDMIFNSIDKCILFSEFELETSKAVSTEGEAPDNCVLNTEVNKEIKKYFEVKLSEYADKLERKEITLLEYIQFTTVVLAYVDVMLKYNFVRSDQIKEEIMYRLLKSALKLIYLSLTNNFKSNNKFPDQIKLLECVKGILTTDYDPLLGSEVRLCISEDFFYCLNNILKTEVSTDGDEIVYEADDFKINPNELKHSCICLLAAYCRQRENYTDEILELIFDREIYNFSNTWDVDCAFQCIELLSSPKLETPLVSIFTLMQGMCKHLYRNATATFKILKVLLRMLDKIWLHDNNMKRNCCIMIKGYLERCEQLYYSPDVAALIYECAAKVTMLNHMQKRDDDIMFREALIEKIKGDIHNIRLYCCYLLKLVFAQFSDVDIESYLAGLSQMFVIEVSERNEFIIKDESANRTLTVLHCLFALAQIKQSLLHRTVMEAMQVQKDKSLDKQLVKKTLDIIVISITKKNLATYLNNNVLSILNYWLEKSNALEHLPLYLFGFETMDAFLEEHLQWLISADILWRSGGIIKDSDLLKQVVTRSGNSVETIIETCICNIIVLCLPYVVTEKYKLSYIPPGKWQWNANANKMFQSTCEILNGDKWSALFVENLSELVLLFATHLSDHSKAKHQFQVDIPKPIESYHYPTEVFSAILRYLGELINENIIQHLCVNRPMAIFRTLFKLWGNVFQEKLFEFKVLYLHSYVTFLETIPLCYSSDAFVGNFACNSLACAIKVSQSKEEIRVFIIALKIILERFLLEKVEVIRNSVSQILSILMVKKEEGYESECDSLLSYLVIDMKDYLKENEDVVDFISSMSQGLVDNVSCSTKVEVLEKLKTYNKSLSCPSHETLMKMRQFLKINKHYVNSICADLNPKGFSDDCDKSMIHQIIFALSNTLKLASDDKTRIEACNCLTEIGNYDLKTLVTVAPVDTQKIIDVRPRQYFAIVLMTSLAEVLFGEKPAITNQVANTLRRLFSYREGKVALDLGNSDKLILTPFARSNCNANAEFKIDDPKFNTMCTSEHWIPKGDESDGQWLKRVTIAILDVLASGSNYLNTLRPVCDQKPGVCRKILPPLMGLLIECSSEQQINTISERIKQFFKHVWEMSYDTHVENSEDSNGGKKGSYRLDQENKMIVQYMLDVVNFIRLQRNHYKPRPDQTIETLNYLRLEYDKVAWAATVAGQNVAAIYYGELWAAAQNGCVPPSSPEATTQLTGGENIQRILRKGYISIGEIEALDGCGIAHLTSEDEKRKHLINTGQFTDALLLHDIALSCGGQVDDDLQYGAVKSLHKSGMHHLALHYIKSLPENDELNDIKYECLSFLGDWTELVDTRDLTEKSKRADCNPHSIIKAFRYSCLKDCLNLHPTPDLETKLVLPLNRAKLAVTRLCQNLNMENCQSVYKVLGKLHLICDIEDYFSVRCDKVSIQELLTQWQVDQLPAFHDIKHLEALISQRSLILEHAAKSYNRFLKDIVALQLQYAELGLSSQRVQMAQRLLAVVKQLQTSDNVALVDSQIAWAKGHKDIALSLLRNIVAIPSPDVRLTAVSLRQYGLWIAESKRDNARDIINKYLMKSLEVLSTDDHVETKLKVYYDIAKFADAEYKQVVTYMNSAIFEKKVKCVENMKDTASSLRSTQQSLLSRDERKALLTNEKFRQIDEAEIANTKAEKESFLHLAMRYYLLSLKQCEENNLTVFRVISLWLDNPSLTLANSEHGRFEDLLHAIPSRKYIMVLPQLAPRLTNEKTAFAENLRKIIKRCAVEHPHHTLPILFSLKNSDKDQQMAGGSKARSQEPRVIAADALIQHLARDNNVMAVIISQMEKMCNATISFANYVPNKKDAKQRIPGTEHIHRLGHLDAIPIPTVTIPISNYCKYPHIQTLYSFENYFELVGGINCPKKITCRSSDGTSRILLVKGEDDLRQDAVMQQVFNIVNTLLEKNLVTSRNKFFIRTYKVVPLSRRSGVLEWCEGTMPIGLYLIGNSNKPGGAHARYRPQDISVRNVRDKIVALQGKSIQEKLSTFLGILNDFKPVFHYFFTEHYLDPVTWYERRLAYTKSVASSSMVGYILGLGDRHVQNILIDKRTAEVVHIDFGIAFDQAKTLPTPETIPFRLTQDIVAGFGSSGVEGIFRRCSENTMQLLRDNQEMLLTILEVLLCDPLYSWTVTSKQQNVLPASKDNINCTSGSDGSLAKRALLTVSSKLSGTEGGVAGGVAVPGQVARLIHSAVDPANLCRLYPGWQPYL